MSAKQVMALTGAVLMAIGVFCPFVSVPIMGSVSYFGNGKGDGTIVLLAALVIGWLALRGSIKPAAFAAGAALALILTVVVRFNARISEAREQLRMDMADNPFSGLGEAMVGAVQLQWGVGVMAVGTLLVIAAAVWNPAPAAA